MQLSLSLSPKKEAQDFLDFRLISPVGCLYKIISNVLFLRMHHVMDSVVSTSQGAFVKGRQIVNGIIVANKEVDRRKKSKKPGLVCKIDMEKAYDRVN